MSSFREAVGVATKSAICTVLAGAEASSYVSRIGIPAPGSQTVINTVRNARRAVCDNPEPEVTGPEPPFAGGQCDAVVYDVSVRYITPTGISQGVCNGEAERVSSPSRYYGPIGGVRILPNSNGCSNRPEAGWIQIFCRGSAQPGGTLWDEQDWFTLGIGTTIYSASINDISRADGQPDDCGDPDAPPIPPYSPVTISRDVTYVDASETEITEEGDFTINAPFIIGGNIIAPVSIDLGGVVVPVELNLSTGDITFEFEGGDTPAPTDGDDDGEDTPRPDDEPDIEEDLLIYGLIVYSTPTTGEGSVTSEIAQGDAPLLLLPRTGNVWFQIPVGDRVTWAGPIPVQSQNQLVRVPDGMAASGYRLFPNTGWQLSEVRMGKPPCGCVSG